MAATDTIKAGTQTLRLSPEDNVIVATVKIEAGSRDRRRPDGAAAHSLRPQGRQPRHRARRPGRQVRPDHRLRVEADRARRLGPRAQLRHGPGARRLRARLPVRAGRAARERPAGRGAGDLPGLSPRQRQGRHAQLYRHPDQRELLDHGRRLHRQGDRTLGRPRRLSQHRRHRGAEAGQWLRHRLSRRHLRHAEEDDLGLCDQPEHGRRHHGRARLRGLPDPALQGGLRRHRERDLPHHDDPGSRRYAQDGGGRRRGGQGDAAYRQPGEARDACRPPT